MNVFKLSCCLIMTVVLSGFMCAMEESSKLSTIEKQLILREVKKLGKDYMLAEIRKERQDQPLQYDEERDLFYFKRPLALKINETFYKVNREKDPLTRNIFDAIQKIEALESKGLNRPEYDYGSKVESDEYLLGQKTDYQWIDNGSAVKIKSRFSARPYDQIALENVVNSYNQ